MAHTSQLDEPADIHAEIGSKTWARGVASKIRFVASQLDFDVSTVHRWIQIAVENGVWSILGYVSLDAFLVKEAGITQDFIDAIRNAKKGTRVGDVQAKVQEARDKPLPSSNQAEAPRNPAGRKGKESDRDSTRLVDRSSDYLLRRLARDCPELLDRIESGELSVNAAAIQAGIRKKLSHAEQCVRAFDKAPDRVELAKSILERLEAQELEVLRGWLSEQEG
jgi:hypothetical protein